MKTFIQLGRLGDILSILPLLYHEHQQGNRCGLMVAQEYRPLLDGCSYLEPITFIGPHWNLQAAFDIASMKNGQELVVTQVNGPLEFIEKYAYARNGQKTAMTDSFVKESWKLAGKLDLWKTQPPLVFDKRDSARETSLLEKYLPPTKSKKKLLLVSLSGNTAPFPYADLLWELLDLKLTGWRVLDLSKVQAEYFYDVLAIYERADALLASDSAPLHMAHATPNLPVLALVNDKPNYWHGAPWRPNHIFHCRYEDFARYALELFRVLEKPPSTRPLNEVDWYLCWNRSEERGEKLASIPEGFLALPIACGANGKDCTLIGDQERHPYLRGVLQLALMRLRPADVLVLIRPNVQILGRNRFSVLQDNLPCYAHRMVQGCFHPAIDLFAAPKRFWEMIFPLLPDLIMGRDRLWPRVLMEIFKANGAKEVRDVCFYRGEAPPPKWHPKTPPRLEHNQKLASSWLAEHGLPDLFPRISKQVLSYPLNHAALPENCYNPSITRVGENILMTYRFHTLGGLNSALGISEIESHGVPIRSARLPIPGHSVEDAKFFRWGKERWLSWVESDYSGQPNPEAIMKVGRLTDDWRVENVIQPDYGKNDWNGIEKNWVFFVDVLSSEHGLYSIYKTDGTQIAIRVNVASGKIFKEWQTPGPRWNWGPIKGGFIAGEYEGRLLRFFHSTLDNEEGLWRRRYYVGALLMETSPPFEVVKVSREPLLYGSADDDLTDAERAPINHFKGRVVFPGGAVKLSDGWLLAVGINDCRCGLVKITDLKL